MFIHIQVLHHCPKKTVGLWFFQLTGQLGIGTTWHHSVCSLLLFALLDSTSRTHSALWRVSPSFEVPLQYGSADEKRAPGWLDYIGDNTTQLK